MTRLRALLAVLLVFVTTGAGALAQQGPAGPPANAAPAGPPANAAPANAAPANAAPADAASAGPPAGAAPASPPAGPPAGAAPAGTTLNGTTPLPAEEQQVTVYLRGVPMGARALVQRGEDAPLEMRDPGVGVLAAELRGPPARFLPLRLLLVSPGGATQALYDGLVILGDGSRETIAFQYQDRTALRLPVSPSAQVSVALDQRVSWWVSFGWGALVLAWMSALGVVWAIRSR